MNVKYMKRFNGAFVAALIFAFAVVVQPVSAATNTVFDSVPSPLPPSNPSLGYEATQTAEFGAKIEFAAGERKFGIVNVVMNSWACETGNWYTGDCVTTTPGASYQHPVTLNVYGVATDGTRGGELTSVTKNFEIPYRPSADSTCPFDGQWRSAPDKCQYGFNNLITFELNGVTLPNQVIYGVEFNTSTSGYEKIGTTGDYDALNVSVVTAADVKSGTHLQTFRSSNSNSDFQADAGYASNVPAVQFNASKVQPTNKDQCKNDGWKNVVDKNGNTFKNQGQCVSSVASNKNNQ